MLKNKNTKIEQNKFFVIKIYNEFKKLFECLLDNKKFENYFHNGLIKIFNILEYIY